MVMTFRGGKELEADIKEQAKALGMSANAYMVMKLSNAVTEPIDFSELEEVRGGIADGMTTIGVNYIVDGILGRKTRYVVAEGYLWLQKRTLNWSQRYLTKVCKVPTCVLEFVGRDKLDYLAKNLESNLGYLVDALFMTAQLEALPWFQQLTTRRQRDIFEYALKYETNIDDICSEYNPQPVITEPVLSQPEEVVVVETAPEVETPAAPAKRVKSGQLMALYGIAQDVWKQSVNIWRATGFESPDGLWRHIPTSNKWVLQ